MRTLSQDITGLLLAVRVKYTFTNSLIYLLTYLWVSETFWRRLTVDLRLLIAMYCRCGYLIKLRGLMRIKILRFTHFCWPDDTSMGTALPATHEALPLRREAVEWAKYKNKYVWCDLWSSCCNVICVCWMARRCPVAYWSPTDCLFETFQAASVK